MADGDNKVVGLVPGSRPDAEVAEEIRRAMTEKLDALCAVLDEAKSKGFVVNFGVGQDYRGRAVIGSLIIAKHF